MRLREREREGKREGEREGEKGRVCVCVCKGERESQLTKFAKKQPESSRVRESV